MVGRRLVTIIGIGGAGIGLIACSSIWGFDEVYLEEPADAGTARGETTKPRHDSSAVSASPDADSASDSAAEDAASNACSAGPTVFVVGAPTPAMGPCWSGGECLGGYPVAPDCPAGYRATRTEQACGNPRDCATNPNLNWALCTFFNVDAYGCADPTYAMGVVARECTCP